MNTDTQARSSRHLSDAREALEDASIAMKSANLAATCALGAVLRSVRPEAATATLEWDDGRWFVGTVEDASGSTLPIDHDSEEWLDAEDSVDEALSLMTLDVSGERSDDGRTVTVTLHC